MDNNLLENLNKEQVKAVTSKERAVLIVAGAGTGKTTVITQRIAYIIEQGWANSDEILALTFTEKAAGEMEERVDRLLPFGYLDLWISTFHSFGERILKEHGLEIGLPAGFKLFNEFEQWALIKKNLDKFELDYYRPLGNPTKFIHALVKHFSRVKDEDISPEQYLSYGREVQQNLDTRLGADKKKGCKNFQFSISGLQTEDKKTAEQEVARINEVANAYLVYQQLLLDNNALDFGDLINYCLKLFRTRPKILEKYKKQFKYILVDEFQDTNWAQYELIKMLAVSRQGAANNLMVVGDDDQSIYKFRGASVSNILQFKKDFSKAKEIVLVNNYRSTQNILDLSYKFIQLNNPNRLECKLDNKKKSLDKKLLSQEKVKGEIDVIKEESLGEEIKSIVEKIADLKIKDKEASWNDFGILVRANDSAREICLYLDQAKLPYLFLASRGLYSKPVVMDVVAYFKMLDDYHESIALYRVLNLPFFDFTYKELVDFNYVANKKAWSLFTVLDSANGKFGAVTQQKIDKVLGLIKGHTVFARDKNTQELYLAFLNDSGYLKYLSGKGDRESQETLSYLNQFLKRIQKFEASSDDKSVKAFLAEMDMEIDAGEEGAVVPDFESGPEAIKIMTVHGSKGLEFKYVFIVNLVDKRFPTIERKEQIEIPEPLIKEILPEGDIHLEEERRLFYVAMTRAKSGLYFSWAPDYGGVRKKKPSRFLDECDLIKKTGQENKSSKTKKNKDTTNLQIKKSKNIIKKEIDIKTPSYFSYTQLAAFSNCPYQYRFAHILRIPRKGKPQFSFGSTLHNTLQKVFEALIKKNSTGQEDLFGGKFSKQENIGLSNINFDEICKIYEDSWIDEWYNSAGQKTEYKKKGKEILKAFYQKYKDNWPNAVFVEKGFNIKIREDNQLYTVRGKIDRVDEVEGKLKIVDYKTGVPKIQLSFDEKEQLLIYQIAAQGLFSKKIQSLAFYYLEDNSEVEFLGTDEELEKVNDKVLGTIKDIKKGEFLPKPSVLCRYCDFFDICEFRKS